MTEPRIPAISEPAPLFTGQVTGDGTFGLLAQLGKWVVVYFFPRANTPG